MLALVLSGAVCLTYSGMGRCEPQILIPNFYVELPPVPDDGWVRSDCSTLGWAEPVFQVGWLKTEGDAKCGLSVLAQRMNLWEPSTVWADALREAYRDPRFKHWLREELRCQDRDFVVLGIDGPGNGVVFGAGKERLSLLVGVCANSCDVIQVAATCPPAKAEEVRKLLLGYLRHIRFTGFPKDNGQRWPLDVYPPAVYAAGYDPSSLEPPVIEYVRQQLLRQGFTVAELRDGAQAPGGGLPASTIAGFPLTVCAPGGRSPDGFRKVAVVLPVSEEGPLSERLWQWAPCVTEGAVALILARSATQRAGPVWIVESAVAEKYATQVGIYKRLSGATATESMDEHGQALSVYEAVLQHRVSRWDPLLADTSNVTSGGSTSNGASADQ